MKSPDPELYQRGEDRCQIPVSSRVEAIQRDWGWIWLVLWLYDIGMKAACLCVLLCWGSVLAAADEPLRSGQESVVKLFGAGGLRNLANYGSGCLISPDGDIVTVWSHLLDSDVVTVILHDGRRYLGRLVAADSRRDVALLKIDAEGLPHFRLDQAVTAGPGVRVLAFSNVFKVATGDEPVTVMHGVISAVGELSARRGRFDVPYQGRVYFLDALTNNPGAAGGALTTMDGRLLAMLGRELRSSESNTWVNYAVPFTDLRQVIQDLKEGRYTREDPLATVDPERGGIQLADYGIVLVPDVVARTPAYIDSISAGSPAEAVGLMPDDLIVFANGQLVSSLKVLRSVLNQAVPGDDLVLVVRRDDQLVTVTIRPLQRE